MTTIRYDTHAMDHSTALHCNETMERIECQGYRTGGRFSSSALRFFSNLHSVPRRFTFGETPFYLHPHFCLGGLDCSLVCGRFSFTPKIELD